MKLNLSAIAICFLFLFSCKKDPIVENRILPKVSGVVNLVIDQKINDTTLILKWNKYGNTDFKSYTLTRTSRIFKDGSFVLSTEVLRNFTNADSLTYLENKMPYAPDVQYLLSVNTDPVKFTNGSRLIYQRPTSYLTMRKLSDVLMDEQLKTVYLIDQEYGTIISYNYETNKKIQTTKSSASFGYSALGNFEGSKELYVPLMDGWIQILDAVSLTLKDRIYVGGTQVSSIVATNGKLIVSSSDRSFASLYNNTVKIYDRKTKNVLGRTGNAEYTRLMLLENTDYEFIDISVAGSPGELSYYKINSDGLPLTNTRDSYHGDHPLSGSIVRCFPDGQKFITSASGTVYTKGLVFEKNITNPYSNLFSDFAFNGSGSTIYCAYANEKKIQALSYPSLSVIQTIKTNLVPTKIFRSGNQLIAITKDSDYTSFNEAIIFIEKITL